MQTWVCLLVRWPYRPSDTAVVTVLRFINDPHQGLIDMAKFPAIAADAALLEVMSVFQEICQELIPPG